MSVPSGYLAVLAVVRYAYSQYGGDDLESLSGDMEIHPDTEQPMDPAMADDWEEALGEDQGFNALVAFLQEYVSRNQPSDAGMARFMSELGEGGSEIHRVAVDAMS